MAVDSDAVGNGITLTGNATGFNEALNTDPDQASFAVQATILRPVVDIANVEPFRRKGTTAASIEFKQVVAHSAETWQIRLTYKIYTSS